MNARRGLQKCGMRAWSVTGKNGTWIIERHCERDWRIRPETMDRPFYVDSFASLRNARITAEGWAGVEIPHFLDRRAA